MDKAIEYIIKSDVSNVCNELYDKYVYGKAEKADPKLITLIKCAWAAQCQSLDELTDKNETEHLDVELLLKAIERNERRHKKPQSQA